MCTVSHKGLKVKLCAEENYRKCVQDRDEFTIDLGKYVCGSFSHPVDFESPIFCSSNCVVYTCYKFAENRHIVCSYRT